MAKIKTVDIEILRQLKDNLDITAVAKKLGLRSSTMYYHFKKLKEKGFIKGYRTSFKAEQIDGEYMFILLSLTSLNKKNSEELLNLLKSYSDIVLDVFSISGGWDYLISVAGQKEKITDFITNGLHALKNVKRTYSILVIRENEL